MMDFRFALKLARRRAWRLKRQIAIAVTLTVVAVGFVASAASKDTSAQHVDAARVSLTAR